MNTKTVNLYIIQRGEITDVCTTPWCASIKEGFISQYKRERMYEERTALVEASDDNEAFDKYCEEIDRRLPYETDETVHELHVACQVEIARAQSLNNHFWQ